MNHEPLTKTKGQTMQIHLRFDDNTPQHTRVTLFVSHQNVGQLCLSPAQAIWLHHILHEGCKRLSPPGTKPIKFFSSGKPPLPTDEEIDSEVQQ